MRCLLRLVFLFIFVFEITTDVFVQNLQQSRGFGSSFKFPEGDPAVTGGAPAASSGNAGFADDNNDDDLYA